MDEKTKSYDDVAKLIEKTRLELGKDFKLVVAKSKELPENNSKADIIISFSKQAIIKIQMLKTICGPLLYERSTRGWAIKMLEILKKDEKNCHMNIKNFEEGEEWKKKKTT